MSLKQEVPEGVYGMVLQDLRDMVKAILPEPQFPSDATGHPSLTAPNAVLSEYGRVAFTAENFHPTDSVKR